MDTRLLARNFLFRALSPAQLSALAAAVTVRSVEAGEAVFTQDQPGDAMYLIRRGSVDVERHGQLLATLDQGHHFGEMALVDGYPRSATVKAVEPSDLLVIHRNALIDALRADTAMAAAIYRNFTYYLSKRLRETSETAARYKHLADSDLDVT